MVCACVVTCSDFTVVRFGGRPEGCGGGAYWTDTGMFGRAMGSGFMLLGGCGERGSTLISEMTKEFDTSVWNHTNSVICNKYLRNEACWRWCVTGLLLRGWQCVGVRGRGLRGHGSNGDASATIPVHGDSARGASGS